MRTYTYLLIASSTLTLTLRAKDKFQNIVASFFGKRVNLFVPDSFLERIAINEVKFFVYIEEAMREATHNAECHRRG
jgi:hypothetical protein